MIFPVATRSKAWVYAPLACWDFGFESRQWHGCLCLVSVVCSQAQPSATVRSFVQRSPTEYILVCIIECDQVQC
jgi:hypothetical protein